MRVFSEEIGDWICNCCGSDWESEWLHDSWDGQDDWEACAFCAYPIRWKPTPEEITQEHTNREAWMTDREARLTALAELFTITHNWKKEGF